MSEEEYDHSEEIEVEVMVLNSCIVDPHGVHHPVELQITYPTGQGFAGLAAMQDVVENGFPELYAQLLNHGDHSVMAMEGDMILKHLAKDMKADGHAWKKDGKGDE